MCDSGSDTDLLASLLSAAGDEDDPKPSTVDVSQQSKLDQEPDSDDDLLATLLGNEDDDCDSQPGAVGNSASVNETQKSTQNDSSSQRKTNALKELDFNFLDDISDDIDEDKAEPSSPKNGKNASTLVENDADSSDEEDKKYFEAQRYSEYGRDIKRLIKTQEAEKESLSISLTKENSFNSPTVKKDSPSLSKSFKSKVNSPSLSSSFNGLSEKSDKYSLQPEVSPRTSTSVKKDVYSDPIFGLRIVNPLISSSELVEKMQGRKPVTVSAVKLHLLNSKKSEEDWVIAGVVLNKSAPKTSVKGNQYCIWKISDLSTEMNSVSVFLFSGAYKHLWKLPTGTVVGILNPSVLESKDDRDLATLSVDNEHKVMLLGSSKDLGKCKSMKKNGEPCTAPVNLRRCEYCIYHVKQEYGKFSKRTDLQSHGLSNTIGHLGTAGQPKKPTSIYQQRNPDAKPFIAIPAKRNEAQIKKDRERLAMLRGDVKPAQRSEGQAKAEPEKQLKSTSIDLSTQRMKKDLDRLNKLRGWGSSAVSPSSQQDNKSEVKILLSSPRLANGLKGGFIDFTEPTPKTLVNKAKITALEYVQKFGGFKKTNPNRVRPSKDVLSERGVKRRREEEDGETVAEKKEKKEQMVKNRFQEMLEMKSAHTDLIEKHEDEETEQYFRKQLAKERMEEKMLTTYKVPCKAVQCKVCKYVAFSSSDLCKKLQHPIKVYDAVKRFFKCGDCGNRTVSLDRIPTETCKKCSSSKWVRAAMMDEKKTQLASAKLSIRGAEEKFIGATITGENLDLLVPESD